VTRHAFVLRQRACPWASWRTPPLTRAHAPALRGVLLDDVRAQGAAQARQAAQRAEAGHWQPGGGHLRSRVQRAGPRRPGPRGRRCGGAHGRAPLDLRQGAVQAHLGRSCTRCWTARTSSCRCSDARDPMGTRSAHVEKHLRRDARHKHLVFVLNKCDLVPDVGHAPLGRGALGRAPHAGLPRVADQALRQGLPHRAAAPVRQAAARSKKNISVGFIGMWGRGCSSPSCTRTRRTSPWGS